MSNIFELWVYWWNKGFPWKIFINLGESDGKTKQRKCYLIDLLRIYA